MTDDSPRHREAELRLILGLLLASCVALRAQPPFVLAPDTQQVFLDNNGHPLAGGQIFTYLSGTTTPVATYVDSNGTTPNTNPVILTAAGTGAIWLSPSIVYRFVIEDSTGVTIKTVDGISVAMGGATNAQYWQLSGTQINNTNAGGAGDVGVGANLHVAVNAIVGGGLQLLSPGSTNSATIAASNSMPTSVSWKWPISDGVGCLTSDGAGNLSFAACSGGGSGSPGGPGQSVQYNNGGAFGGSNNLLFTPASSPPQLSLAGVYNANGSTGGFDAATATAYNTFQAPSGGMLARSFTAVKYIQAGQSAGAPSATTSDTFNPGAMYWDTGSMGMQVFNGTSWVSLGGGSGSPGGADTDVQFNSSGSFAGSNNFIWNGMTQTLGVSGTVQANGASGAINAPLATAYNAIQAPMGGMHALSFTATNYVQAGNSNGVPSPTTSDTFHAGALYWDTGTHSMQVFNDSSAWVSLGGGMGSPGGANTDVQFNSSGAFAGSGNFIWNNVSQILGVSGTIQANGGTGAINAPLATAYNAIQAPMGGMAALSFTAVNYIQAGNAASTPTPTTSDTFHAGALYYDTTAACLKVHNGTSFNCITSGSGSPGGANTNIQFNNSGLFGGSANLTWNNSTQQLGLTTTSGQAGITVANGYINSAQGFISPFSANYNTFQSPSGGMLARNFTALNYVQSGFSSTTPGLSVGDTFNPGALYFNTVSQCEQVFNGATWACIGGSGGTPAGPSSAVQFNNGGAFGGSANFEWVNTTPQSLTITTASGAQGLRIVNGYATADIGFLASSGTALNYNAIQAPSGGLAGRSVTATTYVQTGQSAGVPSVTSSDSFHPGAMFYNTSVGSEQVFNGSTWVSLATGGVVSLNGLTGALGIAGTANEINVSAGGTTVQISTPQPIATTSNPTFAGVTSTGAFNATGGGITFQAGGGAFQVNSSGALSTAGVITTSSGLNVTTTAANSIQTSGSVNSCNTASCAGGIAFAVAGATVVNNVGQWTGAAVLANGNVQANGVFAIQGGFFGETATVNAGGCSLFIRGGIIYGHSGSC